MSKIKKMNEWYGSEETSKEMGSVTIKVEGEGKLADHVVEQIEKIVNMTQGDVKVFHNGSKIM
jgi:hypothetical protein